MTKEEYSQYLASDYWKGFSFSIIKERNFTCEDCGRKFPNERNKLQVHHLVYRDVAPWAYKPEELVVLCEYCHRMRHGLLTEDVLDEAFAYVNTSEDCFCHNESINMRNNIVDEKIDRWADIPHEREWEPERKSNYKRWIAGALYVLFAVFLFKIFIIDNPTSKPDVTNKESLTDIEPEKTLEPQQATYSKRKVEKTTPLESKKDEFVEVSEENVVSEPVYEESEPVVEEKEMTHERMQKSTLEILEDRQHQDAVRRAKRAGVSTEGSTLDILERIQHQDAVRRAKRAGVSTEGSTLDILERIQHQDAVRRAKRAGVSTEGSTLDILERMQHQDAVRRAKLAGVSTEGSTLDILERINRKEMEKYGY